MRHMIERLKAFPLPTAEEAGSTAAFAMVVIAAIAWLIVIPG